MKINKLADFYCNYNAHWIITNVMIKFDNNHYVHTI